MKIISEITQLILNGFQSHNQDTNKTPNIAAQLISHEAPTALAYPINPHPNSFSTQRSPRYTDYGIETDLLDSDSDSNEESNLPQTNQRNFSLKNNTTIRSSPNYTQNFTYENEILCSQMSQESYIDALHQKNTTTDSRENFNMPKWMSK